MQNKNLSLLDTDQMSKRTFDQEHDAQRVILVGSDGQQIADSIKDALKDIKIEVPQAPVAPAQSITQVVPSFDVIKIPYQTVVKEIEIKEIEKQVFVPEYRIIEIEKQVIVPEYRSIEIPIKTEQKESKLLHILLVVQTLASIILSIMHFYHTK